ncbi:hypothetical protein HYV69_01560 [Candidatus Uhrbacteria bacterium]|nr:hypothetical protein [Candidatus Uhrbacteria bacterium]
MERKQLLLQESGLIVKGGGATKPPTAASKGEIAQPSRFTQMLAIWGELIDIAVLTDNRRRVPIEVRKREMTRRFVRDPRDPQVPLLVKAMIFAENVTRFNRETKEHELQPGIGLGYKAEIQVSVNKGSDETVKAVPHILVDGAGGMIPYGTFEESGGKTVVNAREHFCMVLWPMKKGQPFRLLPLGLASASRLDMWNRVAQGLPGRGLPTIEPIRHNLLAKDGARYLVYTPPGMWQFDGEEGKASYHYGHICGQTARVIEKGGFPPYDDEENCTFSEQRVFLVELGERSIGLQYVGRKGKVKLLEGTIDLGQSLAVEPFEALGVSVLTANPSKQSRTAFELAGRGAFTLDNPLFAYAVRIGLVDPVVLEDTQSVRSSLNRLASLVVSTLRDQLDDIKRRVVEQLCRDLLPDSEIVLDGKSAEEVWHRNGGEDFLAKWINERIEGDFDWSSWVHRGVRMELLKRISERAQNVGTPPALPVTFVNAAPIVAEVLGLVPTPAKRIRKPRASKPAQA